MHPWAAIISIFINFFLSSHRDPIGDQNDVQELSIYYVYLAYLVHYLPTVLRAYLPRVNGVH